MALYAPRLIASPAASMIKIDAMRETQFVPNYSI
jgi:hypothetical protein